MPDPEITYRIVDWIGGEGVSRQINISAIVLVIALLVCEINFAVTDTPYHFVSDELSDGSIVLEQDHSQITDSAFAACGTPELISGRNNGSLISIRSQAKGKTSQRSPVRNLLLFILSLCFLKAAFSHLKSGVLLPEDAVASSVVLFFIHNKDGKK